MNMKKTIAAAAAGAMAVSATATAASAATTPVIAPSGTFTYTLVKNFAKEKMGTATVTSERQVAGLNTTNLSTVVINLTENKDGTNGISSNLYIDVETDKPASLQVQSSSDTTVLVRRSFTLDGDDADVGAAFAQDGIRAIKGTGTDAALTRYLVLDETEAINRNFNSILVQYTATVQHRATNRSQLSNALLDNVSATNQALNTEDGVILGIGTTDAIASAVLINNAAGATYSYDLAYRNVTAFAKWEPAGTLVEAPMLSNTNTYRYGSGVPNIINYLEGFDNTEGSNRWYVKNWSSFPAMGDVNSTTGADIGTAKNVRSLIYMGRNTTATDPEKVIAGSMANGNAKVEDGKEYYNVMATLNDTAANYDLLFTFNTAAKPVFDAAKGRAKPDKGEVGAYDADDGDASYMQFGQHVYGYYGNEIGSSPDGFTPFGAEYYFSNPAGLTNYNLFQGALVVNDYYSMQLSNTELFSYSLKAISFDYDNLQANALASYNTWMDYIQSLRLATSREWYWDSMTITWSTPVADTAGVGEGLEEDDVTLEEEEVPVEEEEVVVEEPVAPAPNPPTGNSAVALAVIPVALAAAAIVAKKRK
jgi:hypothetical protein